MKTRTFLTIILLICSRTTFAQPGNPREPDANTVPIEGEWIIVLLGGVLGVTGVLKHRKNKLKSKNSKYTYHDGARTHRVSIAEISLQDQSRLGI